MNRDQKIIRTSIIGIIANVFLAGFKAAVGLLSNSVAVVLDAVNNLSDALSSLITIIGTKLAGRAPDKKHPLGHGRIEYLSATVIAVIVLYAGITSFVESVKKIIHPEKPDYSTIALVIIAVAVLVKIFLGTYVKKVGKEVHSDSLIASGSDAQFDSIISASTLVAALIYLFTKVSLEAWLGAIISIVIIKSGFEMLQDPISEILGKRVDPDLANAIRKTVLSFEQVSGVYDLIVHNYGPDRLIGSVHIEVPETMTASELDILERAIAQKVYMENHVGMTGISVYSRSITSETVNAAREKVYSIVRKYPEVIQLHGFYLDEETQRLLFDIIIDYDVRERMQIYNHIVEEVQKTFPDYTVQITLDLDIAD